MDPPGRLIEQFLATHPGYFCVDCLAEVLGIPVGQISMVIHRLKTSSAFTSQTGLCSRCGRRAPVIQAA
jgi:hypothetical protein